MGRVADPSTVHHLDLIGKEIFLGSYVAVSNYRQTLSICKVISVAEKTIRLKRIDVKRSENFSVYPNQVLALDSEELTMYFLKRGKT